MLIAGDCGHDPTSTADLIIVTEVDGERFAARLMDSEAAAHPCRLEGICSDVATTDVRMDA